MAYQNYKITKAPTRFGLNIPPTEGGVLAPFVVNQIYPMTTEDEIEIDLFLEYPAEPLDSFEYQIQAEVDGEWSDDINFEVNVALEAGGPLCSSGTHDMSIDDLEDITSYFIWTNKEDRIKINSIVGSDFTTQTSGINYEMLIDGVPVVLGKTYMRYEFVNVTFKALYRVYNAGSPDIIINFSNGTKSAWVAVPCTITLDLIYKASIHAEKHGIQEHSTFAAFFDIRNGIPSDAFSGSPTVYEVVVKITIPEELSNCTVSLNEEDATETILVPGETYYTIPLKDDGSANCVITGTPLVLNSGDPYYFEIPIELISCNNDPDLVDDERDNVVIAITNDKELSIDNFKVIKRVLITSDSFAGEVLTNEEVSVPASPIDITVDIDIYWNRGKEPFTYSIEDRNSTLVGAITQTDDANIFTIEDVVGNSPSENNLFTAVVIDDNGIRSKFLFNLKVLTSAGASVIPVFSTPTSPLTAVEVNEWFSHAIVFTTPGTMLPILSYRLDGAPAGVVISGNPPYLQGSISVEADPTPHSFDFICN